MRIAISALLTVVGIINALPLVGSVSAARLSGLYGVGWSDPTTILLLRHRAVLFGIIGGFILYAAFKPALQPPAMLAAAISMGSFLLFAALDRPAGAGLAGIVISDIIGLAALGLAALLRAMQ
ncbi:MAG TPA: hypothetical protein VD886_03025 [Herpetosiphonaceae bacterium]|nr:hypothetical protein [Herpetosiphonaceae bacterium]